MYIKSVLLISSLVINLGSVSDISSEEVKAVSDQSASAQLDNYYKEFKKPYVADEKCNCNTELPKKPNTLANYYSEFLK